MPDPEIPEIPEIPADPATVALSANPPAVGELKELTFSQEALRARLERERSKAKSDFLASIGFKDKESFETFQAQAKTAAEAQKKAEREKMTELEKYKTDLEGAIQARLVAENHAEVVAKELEDARVSIHLTGEFAKHGIKNISYAFFKVDEAINGLPIGEDLDEPQFIEDLLKDPRERFALGVDDKLPDPKVKPVNTTASQTGPSAKQSDNGVQKHATQMTDKEWQVYKIENKLV